MTKQEASSQVELKVTATPEEFTPYVEQAAKTLTKEKALPGFRPGKAPVEAVVKALGHERVLSEALEYGIPRLFVEAVLAKEIDALGRPATTIEQASLDGPVSFTATVDVLPEVALGDIAQLSARRQPITIDDKRVEQELAVLAKSRSTYLDLDRPAQEGDTLVVDFEVTMDGQPMEGGSSKQHPVQIGEGHFIPDFEQKIQGMVAGDQRAFDMTFPADFADEQLRGKQASATVTAHEVKKRIVPELTDEFAKGLGSFTSLADLKTKIKDNLQAELTQKEQDRLRGELAEQLAEHATFTALPTSLVEREIDRRVAELTQMLTMQQKTLPDYLTAQQKTTEELRAELTAPAEKTIKVSLALRAFAQEQAIELTEEELETKVQEYLQHVAPDDEARQRIDLAELKESLATTLRHQKALAHLEELVDG